MFIMQEMNVKLGKSRWLHVARIFAVCVLVLSFALLLAGCRDKTTDDPQIPADGPEVGVYYYELVDGEALLTLSSGNKFTLVGSVDNKTGTYTVNENEIVFDFLKDEDGTTTATLSGDTLTLNYNNATMSFIKKINYTVSFNVDGGSSVESISVVNGKTVKQPVDPEKDGKVFIGWYTDSSFTTLYDFASAIVKADTTLYARWADKPVGQSEYTVSFDLGYENAPAMAAKPTVGGKLYNVADPERSGYVFGGWYISMYEDGDKLSYAYTADTVFDANTTLYAVWNAQQSDKLAAPSVSVSDSSVSWAPVAGASTYEIKIYDANDTMIYEGREGTNAYSYDFSLQAAGDYKIEVTAIHSNTSKNSDTSVRYFKNKALPRVSGFQVVDGVLIYNAVAGAEKYLVTVDCGNSEHSHTLFDNGLSTSFSFVNCSMQKGGIVFTVTAVANGRASSVSEKFVYDRSLPAIGGIVYDKASDRFVWDTVSGATGYIVTVVAGGNTYVIDNGNKNTISMAGYTGEISVSVVPATAGFNSPDAVTLSCTKTAPVMPQNVTVSGMNVTWSAVEGATSYEVKLGSQVFTVTENSFNLSTDGLTLNKNEVYSVQVKAIKDNESSAYSDAVSVYYYAMGNTLVYKNNTVYWTPVAGVTSFEVRVNGGEPITVTGANSAKVVLDRVGVNKIEVKCTDLDDSDWVSVEVVAYAVTYKSRTFESGEAIEYLAIGDTLTLPTEFAKLGYSLTGWYNTPGAANGNGRPYTSSVFNGTGDMTLYANWTPNDYNIKFVVDGTISNVAENDTHTVTYEDIFKLIVPTTTDASRGYFVGWFDGPSGSGNQLTDAEGNAIAPYGFARDSVAYPFFETGILGYELMKDGTYGVKKGVNIANGVNIKIPVEYKGIAVTAILDNGFYNCDSIVKIEIPDTITRVGVGAFDACDSIADFTVYVANENETYETFYSSHDGALLYYDAASARTYLEIFPKAKTGTYTIPEGVQSVRGLAFKGVAVTKIVIGKDVTNIAPYAFYSADIETIEFAEGGTAPLTIEKNGFASLRKLTTLKLPARLQALENIKDFDSFTALTNLSVEKGGSVYSSSNNMICNEMGDTILYVPVTFRGTFEPQVGITGIGDSVFAYNPRITEVIIPAYVTNIGAEAFKNCSALTKVTVKGGRTGTLTIGQSAFDGSGADTLVFEGGETLDAGSVIIDKNAFANCTDLDTVEFKAGANISSVGDYAFSGCTAIESFSFDASAAITSIGNYAFSGCTGLASFTVPKTVKSIGSYAFSGCEHLSTFAFAEGGSNIQFGGYAFDGCVRLQTVKITASVPSFDGSVFNGCSSIKEIVVAPANTNFKSENGVLYNGDYTEILFYPKALDADIDTIKALRWNTITKIGGAVFSENSKLTEMYIGPNVTVIGEHAFDSCLQLTKVTFDLNTNEGAALSIGDHAFANCMIMTDITVPAYTNDIGAYAFYKTGIASFTIPAGVTAIKEYAFSGSKLTSITIPATVTSIADGAYTAIATLTEVNFALDAGADLVIGTSAATSSNGVFLGTKITSVTLPDRVTYIGAYAFYGVSTLANFTIGENSKLTEIGNYAFYNNSKLTDIALGDSLVKIGDNAFRNSALAAVTIPASVKSIGQYAFSANKIASVTFEAGTEPLAIGNYAFSAAIFTTIELPARVSEIGGLNQYGVRDVNTVFNASKVTAINVAAGGSLFTSIDGILYEKNSDGEIYKLVYCPSAKTGSVVIPNTVTVVESNAFNNTKLSSVEFEEFEKTDPRYATPLLKLGTCVHSSRGSSYPVFGNSTSLRTLKLPSHLMEVGQYAIYNLRSTNIEDPTLSDGVMTFNPDAKPIIIGKNGISNNSGYKAINLPAIAELAGTHALYNNTYVSVLTIAPGSTFQIITQSAFANMELSSFTVPKSVTKIENYAFSSNPLKTIEWEDGCQVKEIGMQAFAYSEFESFTIPDSVIYLGNDIWRYSTTLKTINIPKGFDASAVSSNTPFSGIESLEAIVVDPENPYLSSVDGVLYDYAKTILFAYPIGRSGDTYVIPEGVLKIRSKAFLKYTGKAIAFPSTLEEIESYAFQYAKIESLVIPANVTAIGNYAFQNVPITSLTFGRGSVLRSIGERAFESCGELTALILPDSLMTLGTNAFASCTSLKSVILSASLETVGQRAFYACSALENLVIQEGTLKIDQYAFYSSGLKELELPASLKEIGMYAFNYSLSLEKVEFAKGSQLTTLASGIFSECHALESVVLPDTITSMSAGVFSGCISLESGNIPAGITVVPENTFIGCTALTEVVIPAGVKSIESYAFDNCKSLKSITIGKDVAIIGMYAFNNCESLEEVIFEDGSKLTTIGDGAFAGTAKLSAIDIPDGVTTIRSMTFMNSAIAELSLPANLVTIGASAFENCVNLTAADLPMSVTTVGDRAFAGCKNVVSAEFSPVLESIGASAYDGCEKLTSINIPASVNYMAGNPFTNCFGVTSFSMDPANNNFIYTNGVLLDSSGYTLIYYSAANTAETYTFPETVQEIGAGAFSGSKLKSLVLPDSVTAIYEGTFANSKNLESITLPLQLTSIGMEAFRGCSALTKIVIPDSVIEILDYAFADCTALTEVDFGDRTEYIYLGYYLYMNGASITDISKVLPANFTAFTDYMFQGIGVVDLVIPESITSLTAVGVFADCKNLKSITFPTRVSGVLGGELFMGCTALESVILPDGITGIGRSWMGRQMGSTFAGCTSLKTVEVGSRFSSILASSFDGCSSLTTFTIRDVDDRRPPSLTVGDRAFADCVMFTGTNILSYTTMMGAEAFVNCASLTGSITLNASLGEIPNGALSGCTGITELHINGLGRLTANTFDGLAEGTKIYFDTMTLASLTERYGSEWYETTKDYFEYHFATEDTSGGRR